MRNLYLVRHGKVDFPGGIRRCIGRTDLLMDETGRAQAGELGRYFGGILDRGCLVYASPLARAQETARILAGDRTAVIRAEGLQELDMGEWENVPMDRLKKRLESEPESGEPRSQGAKRMGETIAQILRETTGDVICVAHAGINCAFLSTLLGTSLETSRALPQPYGCFSRIQVGDQGELAVKELGVKPKPAPDEKECQEIWDHCHTPDRVRAHCAAVCREAGRIAGMLLQAGQKIDLSMIRSAALLHDVVRERENHAEAGAEILMREGYPGVAELIKDHHDLECPDRRKLTQEEWSKWLMAAVVYLADKRTQQDRAVSLDERFARSRKRCEQAEDREAALKAHERRYRQAGEVETMIEKLVIGGNEL